MRRFTDIQFDILRGMVARAIGTVKRFVSILDVKPLDDGTYSVRVIRRGGYIYGCNIDMRARRANRVWREVSA